MTLPIPDARIDDRAIEDIDFTIRYCETPTQDLHSLFSAWWCRKKKSRAYSSLGRDYWKIEFFRVAALREEVSRIRKDRCPDCGAKLKAIRCLACDLKTQLEAMKEAKRVD